MSKKAERAACAARLTDELANDRAVGGRVAIGRLPMESAVFAAAAAEEVPMLEFAGVPD
jgi:hypothetical protein